MLSCPYLEVRKTDWEQTRDAFRSPSPGRTRPPPAVCMARAGSVWQALNCLGPTVWELSRVSPAWLRWMLPSSSAAVFFPCACLAEHSHVAEGERGDGRNRALMLPWQTALATWLLEPLFLVSGSSQGSVVPRHCGRPCPGSLAPRMIPGHSNPRTKRLQTHPAQPAKQTPGYGIQGLKYMSIQLLIKYCVTH